MDQNSHISLKFSTFYHGAYTLFVAELEGQKVLVGSDKKGLKKEAVEALMRNAGMNPSKLVHDEMGKPLLLDRSKHISISHGNGWYVLAMSEFPIGVDVEQNRESLLPGKDYFVNGAESGISDLLAIWTAKEAFFKLLGGKIEDLKEEVAIQEVGENWIRLRYKNETYMGDLFYLADNYCVVFCNKNQEL